MRGRARASTWVIAGSFALAQSMVEGLARDAQARVDRVERNPEQLADLGRGQLLDLGENEHLPLVVVEALEDADGLGGLQPLVRPRRRVAELERQRLLAAVLAAEAAPAIPRHAQRD